MMRKGFGMNTLLIFLTIFVVMLLIVALIQRFEFVGSLP